MKNHMLLLLGLASFLTACDRIVEVNVIERSSIENKTGADLQLEVCKLPYKQVSYLPCPPWPMPATVTIEVPNQQKGGFLLSLHKAKVIVGGMDEGHDGIFVSQIFLTDNSFGTVKLCRNDKNPGQATFIDLAQTCPVGSTEQATPVSDCEKAVPVGFEDKKRTSENEAE